MLDTDFPRPPGDVGHVSSWQMPVVFEVIPGAAARRVVDGHAIVEDFVAGAAALAARGARCLVTSCGFLATLQDELALACPVPIATSALLQIPMLERIGRVGVITYDARSLGPAHLVAAGARADTPVVGLPRDGAFHAMIERKAPYDRPALEAEAVAAAWALVAEHGEIASIVLECTNLPPFAHAIHRSTGLPVHDVITLGHWLHAGCVPRAYA